MKVFVDFEIAYRWCERNSLLIANELIMSSSLSTRIENLHQQVESLLHAQDRHRRFMRLVTMNRDFPLFYVALRRSSTFKNNLFLVQHLFLLSRWLLVVLWNIVKYAEKLRWKLCDPSLVIQASEPFQPFRFNEKRFRNCINDGVEFFRKAFFRRIAFFLSCHFEMWDDWRYLEIYWRIVKAEIKSL